MAIYNTLESMTMLCNDCSFKRLPWSKTLASEGYVGCAYLLRDEVPEPKSDWDIEVEFKSGINAEIIAFGWITDGRRAVANQPILKNVRMCYHKLDSLKNR